MEQSWNKVGTKLEQSWNKVGTKLEQSWNKIDLFLIMQNNFKVSRPLLNVHRFEIRQFVCFWKLPIYSDQSNQETNFLRNKIRKQLMPTLRIFFNPQIDTVLLNFIEIRKNEQLYFQSVLNLLLKPQQSHPLFIFSFLKTTTASLSSKTTYDLIYYYELLTNYYLNLRSVGTKSEAPRSIVSFARRSVGTKSFAVGTKNFAVGTKSFAVGTKGFATSFARSSRSSTRLEQRTSLYLPSMLLPTVVQLDRRLRSEAFKTTTIRNKLPSILTLFNKRLEQRVFTTTYDPRSEAFGTKTKFVVEHTKGNIKLKIQCKGYLYYFSRNQVIYWLITNNNLIKKLNSYPIVFQKQVLKTIFKTFNGVENAFNQSYKFTPDNCITKSKKKRVLLPSDFVLKTKRYFYEVGTKNKVLPTMLRTKNLKFQLVGTKSFTTSKALPTMEATFGLPPMLLLRAKPVANLFVPTLPSVAKHRRLRSRYSRLVEQRALFQPAKFVWNKHIADVSSQKAEQILQQQTKNNKTVNEKNLTQLLIVKFTKKLFVLREKRILLFMICNLINKY